MPLIEKKGSNTSMKFAQLIDSALEVHELYQEHGNSWRCMDYLNGLSVDVGDLTRIIMEKEGKRDATSEKSVEHELCDCLWSIIIISHLCGVDIEKEFVPQMRKLKERISDRIEEVA